ncbi:MAG: metal ABC transporter substrate-binding protein [Eubacteriales bacterium]|nr:metal ABC transporter substrate-binding protein [Eubacteriales bacterium]
MKNSKLIALLVTVLMLLGLVAGCENLNKSKPAAEANNNEVSGTADAEAEPAPGAKLKVIASIFPQYDFLRRIGGDKIELSMLLSPGAESHSFEPTPKDLIEISESDLFVYVGGHGDKWVDELLKTREEGKKTLALVDLVETVEEEIVEGMEHHHHHEDEDCCHHHHDDEDAEHEHEDEDCCHHHHDDEDAEHEHEHEHHHHHEHELDEHVWTDPKNAIKIVQALTEALVELDPENQDFYKENAAAYLKELEQLDQDFKDLVKNAKRKTIVVGDRFPFRYFTDAYGLDYYAAFPGCSTEGDASPQTIVFLIEKVKEEGIPVVFHIELSNQKMAESIADASGAQVMLLHGAHNIAREDFEAGLTYLDIMRQNLENLRVALND